MKRKLLMIMALAGSLLATGAPAALADEVSSSRQLGQFVSEMAPEHSIEHGAMFGSWVSTMARGSH